MTGPGRKSGTGKGGKAITGGATTTGAGAQP